MSWRRQLAKLRGAFSREQRERELEEEIRSHIQMEAEENRAAGVAPDEAQFAARRAFGNPTLTLEASREAWYFEPIETLVRDLRHGVRMLFRNPGFAVVAVLTLTLGISASSTMFSGVYEMLIRQPTVSDPQRLMVLSSANTHSGYVYASVSPLDYLDWQRSTHAFDSMAALRGFGGFSTTDVNILRGGEPIHAISSAVSANFFQVLGVRPLLGRAFVAGEDKPGHDREIVLSYGLWQNRFHADPAIVGQTVRVSGDDCTVIGVMPKSFRLWGFPGQLWQPLVFGETDLSDRTARSLTVFGRLKPGESVATAFADIKGIAARIARDFAQTNKDWSAQVTPIREYRVEAFNLRSGPLVLMTATVLVLLIACANVAGLLLVRAGARRREIAIRASLGAGRRRLLRQLLTEALLLGALGAVLGLAASAGAIRILGAKLDSLNSFMSDISLSLNGPVLAFTVAVSLGSVLLFGLVPAIESSRADLASAVKQTAGRGTVGAPRVRMRRLLVATEVVLSLFLLVGSSLLIAEVAHEFRVPLGFDPDGIQTVSLTLPPHDFATPADQSLVYQRALERISHLPGVVGAALSTHMPLSYVEQVEFSTISPRGRANTRASGDAALPIRDRDIHVTATSGRHARYYVVSPEYFASLSIPLLRGRTFTTADGPNSPYVAVVNRTLVEQVFPDGNVIGQYLNVKPGPSQPAQRRQIVGVVADVRDYLGQEHHDAQVYVPLLQIGSPSALVFLKTGSNGPALTKELATAVWSAGSDRVVLGDLMDLNVAMEQSSGAGDKLVSGLMAIFTGLALLLAGVGIYGVIAYAVAQRTQEIGVRMAMGAKRRQILTLVLREVAAVGGLGIVIGIVTSLPLPRIYQAVFEGMQMNRAPLILVGASIFIGFVVLVAAAVPAMRAMRVNPVTALRYE